MKLQYALLGSILLWGVVSCTEAVRDAKILADQPEIYPDYIGVTIPANIAPLDFCMKNRSVQKIDAVITGANGMQIHSQGEESTVIDDNEWRSLLAASQGDSLQIVVSAKTTSGWQTYKPFSIYVSSDSIDYGIAFRLIEPGYEVYSKMGIYQYDLSTTRQTTLIENSQFQGCVNCHSFNRGNPERMSLHIRGPQGATLLSHGDEIKAFKTSTPETLGSCVYPYWHPSGRYIAYSTNTTRQAFHARDAKRIEVFDRASDLQVYDTETNQLLLTPLLMQEGVMETFPAFSADGRTIFFCAADTIPAQSDQYNQIHYNLCSIAFDPDQGTYGDHIDTLINAAASDMSISFPRPSYDGRFLVFTMSRYGQFSIWHPEADLYLLNLSDGSVSSMDAINSDQTESYHSWSSNSRWMVFSSRREDGLFTRPYFTHISQEGVQTKPFLLPQRNPRKFYSGLFMSYNVPEFITGPIRIDRHATMRALESKDRIQMKTKKD